MIRSLDTDAVLHYSLGLICRVIFCWLFRHSRSLFSVLVSRMFHNWNPLQQKVAQWIWKSLPNTKNVVKKSNIIEFKRKLIHLHVARDLCLVSVQQKNSYETFHNRRESWTWQLIAVSEMNLISRPGIPFSKGRGKRERATVVFPPPSPPPLPQRASFRLNESMPLKYW